MIKPKIKTVTMNERGVIVIPEDIRKDLGLEERATLVLIESNNEIILKKEEDAINILRPNEDEAWKRILIRSLQNAWGEEDEVWDKIAKKKG
ncbi:AbrB/MazE/SpoVT family DNA-binding domain-containing protein, partial [Candidatus Micrarchaeota archaeon]|nr:AbrB/MazE/SpoVT family DNA-binding domain-containing protein [Candidatus Micrarchaeota archaeon]